MRTLLSTLSLSVAVIAAEAQQTNQQFVVAKGLAVRPFATQAQLSNPSSIDVDDRGRVWVAEAFNYRKKTRKAGDRILILEDSNAEPTRQRSFTRIRILMVCTEFACSATRQLFPLRTGFF
jgi:hypothetical protein